MEPASRRTDTSVGTGAGVGLGGGLGEGPGSAISAIPGAPWLLLGKPAVPSTAGDGAVKLGPGVTLLFVGPLLTLARLAWASCTKLTCLWDKAGECTEGEARERCWLHASKRGTGGRRRFMRFMQG